MVSPWTWKGSGCCLVLPQKTSLCRFDIKHDSLWYRRCRRYPFPLPSPTSTSSYFLRDNFSFMIITIELNIVRLWNGPARPHLCVHRSGHLDPLCEWYIISSSTSSSLLLHDEHPFHPCSSSHGPSLETLRHDEDDKPWVWESFPSCLTFASLLCING